MSTTSLISSNTEAAAPILQQPPANIRSETMETLFNPGNSEAIKRNLIEVLEHKDQRIYGTYLTSITAVRSAYELSIGLGKFALKFGAWVIDIRRSKQEARRIICDNVVDLAHRTKTTLALPFFALGGLVMPQTVFGSLSNMPMSEDIENQIKISDKRS